MDPQLKERLIGAAVLVALGVWLIPLVLDGPAIPIAEDAAVSLELPLPEDRASMRRETVELGAQAPSTAPPTPAVAVHADPPQDTDSEPLREARAEPVVEIQPAVSAAAPSGDWMVQLGSFGDRENAERLAKRVATFGMSPQVTTVQAGGRAMYRVRVGPHPTRARAEAAVSSLSAHGFVAQVVANN